MERQPIITEEPQEIAVKMILNPLVLKDLLPDYSFQFQSGEVSDESKDMYRELVEFLNTNEELAFPDNINSREDYIKGFQRSIALVKLWIDSIYLMK